jgi:hypothetical protein
MLGRTAEPLVPGSSRLEIEIAIAKLKKYKLSGRDQILVELILDYIISAFFSHYTYQKMFLKFVEFEVLTAVVMNVATFWDTAV